MMNIFQKTTINGETALKCGKNKEKIVQNSQKNA